MDKDVGSQQEAVTHPNIEESEINQEEEVEDNSTLMQQNQEDTRASDQHQSTSSITTKLNKLNCEGSSSSLSDDPKPGPSNSAADFDLEVFDSGSSCSNEECWEIDQKGSKIKVSSASPLTTSSSSQNSKMQSTSQSSEKVFIHCHLCSYETNFYFSDV